MSAFFSYLFFKILVVLHTNTTAITIKVEELQKVADCNNTHIFMRYGVMAFESNPRSCRRNSWPQSFQEGLHLWSRRWSMCFFFKESIHIRINLDQLLWHQAISLVIVVRDVNSTSTGLRLNDLRRPNNLKQKVNFKTSDLGTSDCFLKNKPKVFGLFQLPNLATTDHYVTLTT